MPAAARALCDSLTVVAATIHATFPAGDVYGKELARVCPPIVTTLGTLERRIVIDQCYAWHESRPQQCTWCRSSASASRWYSDPSAQRRLTSRPSSQRSRACTIQSTRRNNKPIDAIGLYNNALLVRTAAHKNAVVDREGSRHRKALKRLGQMIQVQCIERGFCHLFVAFVSVRQCEAWRQHAVHTCSQRQHYKESSRHTNQAIAYHTRPPFWYVLRSHTHTREMIRT
jgi:hypothetical protein